MINKSYLNKPDTLKSLNGTNTGDFIRWNAVTGVWEVIIEPLVLTEINLTPKAASTGAEGTIFYCSDDNYVYVGVE